MGDANAAVHILDIRNCQNGADQPQYDIVDSIIRGLKAPLNAKSLPTQLLYNERGLRLYDQITTDAPEYYLFGAEQEILHKRAPEIMRILQSRSLASSEGTPAQVLLELGAGSMRKTSHILHALAALLSGTPTVPPVTYFALDLEEQEIQRTLTQLLNSDVGIAMQGKIEAKGMLGTYEHGVAFVLQGGLQHAVERNALESIRRDPALVLSVSSGQGTNDTDIAKPSAPEQPQLHMLFLGSSIGNFSRGEDAQFLRSLPLRAGYGDTLLVGLDHDNDREEIEIAYNDPKGLTRDFIMNGLKAAGIALGDSELFGLGNWEYTNVYDEDSRAHKAFYKCLHPHRIIIPSTKEEVYFSKDELVKIEMSLKYSERDACALFSDAGLRPIQRWMDSTSRYSLWLLERPPFAFPLLPSPTTPTNEAIGKSMGLRYAPDDSIIMLFEKPIDLRHICLFYLGHIPTFLDIHLSRLLQEPHTQPEEFKFIFERGMDPNVDDPIQCHPHSEVPKNDEEWPSLSTILSFRERVRERLMKLYANISNGTIQLTRKVARVLFMTYEHEGLHIETLLYMLLQRAGSGTIPPPDFTIPPWESLLASWDAAPKPSSPTVVVEATTVTLGIDDVEADDSVKAVDVAGHVFGWDNESPSRQVSIDTFRISWRPITNGEFFTFYTGSGKDKVTFPASWIKHEDGEVRVRALYGPVSMTIAWDWPVLTSYDNMSVYASVKGGRLPTEPELRVFMDKFTYGYEGGANIGFRNWHPVPATTGVESHGGQGHNGGVWEWTSTIFDKFEGFVPSQLYPGYSADFFDGNYRVVLGGSFATIPRIAERRSMRNWYQHNYPYPWAGARIVYDL
ncbi:hypothetical protein JVT61DRAFT_1084 [Boletus reticuloceps]|uniref:N-methyltransferase n=1 Tax=Boletus reticuloceps TaxID=495285 RepID=A0A8I2YRT0_9AGAM|nr:hypothetical protein JVT61DRAFT_1084 [Boletus reticuloceps]